MNPAPPVIRTRMIDPAFPNPRYTTGKRHVARVHTTAEQYGPSTRFNFHYPTTCGRVMEYRERSRLKVQAARGGQVRADLAQARARLPAPYMGPGALLWGGGSAVMPRPLPGPPRRCRCPARQPHAGRTPGHIGG